MTKTPFSDNPINPSACTPEDTRRNWQATEERVGNTETNITNLGDTITNIIEGTTEIIGASVYFGVLDADMTTSSHKTVSRWKCIGGVFSDTGTNDDVYSGGALSATIPSGTRIWYAKPFGSDTFVILSRWC